MAAASRPIVKPRNIPGFDLAFGSAVATAATGDSVVSVMRFEAEHCNPGLIADPSRGPTPGCGLRSHQSESAAWQLSSTFDQAAALGRLDTVSYQRFSAE